MVETVAQWFKLHLINYLIDKGKLKEELCFFLINTTLLHVEERSIIKLPYR